MPSNVDFSDKTVWITGASSGIGASLAREWAERGANLILSGRDEARLAEVAQECSTETLPLPFDVRDEAALQTATEQAIAWKGGVDHAVANAGVSQRSRALKTDMQVYRDLIDIDLTAQIAFSQGLIGHMADRSSGGLAFISSIAGKVGVPMRTAYCAAKFGLAGYADALRGELSINGVTVHVVYPGSVATDVSRNALTADGSARGRSDKVIDEGIPPAEAAKTMVDAIAAGTREIIIARGMEEQMGEMRRTPDALFDQVAAMVASGYMDKMEAGRVIALEQQRIALANGIELDVVDKGPREAPALIFLHGFPENHRTWRHQVAHLSDRHRCIAPDQRGYRGSSRPDGVDAYDASELIGDIFQLAAALGLKKFTIVGHDWGGAIAWGVALRGQEMGMVVRAVIANAPHPLIFQKLLYTNHHQREASQYMRDFRDTANDALVREQGLGALLERVTNWQNDDAMGDGERALLRQDWSNGEAAIAMLNWYRASAIDVPDMDAPFVLPEGWEPPTLPNLTIPTLVIWALDDTALPAENLEGLDGVVENMTLVEVPNCGHFVPWEAPDAVNAAMDAFLVRTDAA